MSRLFIRLGPFFKIHILFFPLLAASIFGGYSENFATAYISSLIHEFAHIITAKLLGVNISHIEILPFGICGRLKDSLIKNPDNEILISLAGPFLSFTLAFFVWLLRDNISPDIYNCIFPLNILLGAVNLIPIIPLDGGRILKAKLTKNLGIVPALRISFFISYVFTIIIIIISIYGILIYPFNFSLILIGAFLLANLCVEQKFVSKSSMSEILDYKEKLSKNNFNKTYVITAYSSTPARKILKNLSYDRYYIICVVDKNFKVIKTLTEGQVIKALSEKSIKINLGEI